MSWLIGICVPCRGLPQHTVSRLPFLTLSTLTHWDRLISRTAVPTYLSPLTPLFDNPSFPPGIGRSSVGPWSHDSHRRLQLIVPSVLSPTSTNTPSLGGPRGHGDWLLLDQVRSYLRSLPLPNRLHDNPTDFETFLLKSGVKTHTVSSIYLSLTSLAYPDALSFVRRWEAELSSTITPDEWEKAFLLTHSLSVASYSQEKNFKILARWYHCPVILHKMDLSVPDTCWRCLQATGSMLHIWWDCPLISPFWKEVEGEYHKFTGSSTAFTPKVALLSMLPGSVKSVKKGLLRHYSTHGHIMPLEVHSYPFSGTVGGGDGPFC